MKSLLHLFHDSHAGSTRSAQKDSNKLRTQKSEHGSKKNADHKQKKSYSADREEKLADSVHPSRPPDAYKFPALFSFAHSTASSRYDTQRSRDHKRSKTASVIPNDSLPTPPPYHGIAIQPSDTRSINLNSKAEHQHARSFSDSKAQLNYQEIQGSAYPTRGLRDIEKPRPPNGEHREGKVNGETPSYPLPRLHSDTGQSRIADYVEKADGRTQPKVDGAGKVREKRRVQDDSKQAAVIEEHHHRSQEDRRKGKEKEVEKHKDGERERRRYRRDTEKERWGEHENMKERDERTIRSRDDKGRDRGVDMDTIKRVEGQLTGERVRQNSEKEQEKAIRKYINDKDKREGTLGGTENKVKRMERKDRDRVENRHERDPIEHQKRVQLKDPIDRAVFHFPTEKTASKHEKPVIWRPDITQPVPAVPHRTGHVEDQRVPYQPMERDTRRNNGATTNDSRYWKYKQPENNHHLGDALPSQVPHPPATSIAVPSGGYPNPAIPASNSMPIEQANIKVAQGRNARDDPRSAKYSSNQKGMYSPGIAPTAGSASAGLVPNSSKSSYPTGYQNYGEGQTINPSVSIRAAQGPSDLGGHSGFSTVHPLPGVALSSSSIERTAMAPIPLVPTASASTTRHTPTTISESPLASLHSSNHGDHRAVHTPSRQIPELLRAPLPHPAPTRQFDHAPEANELRSNSLGDQTKSVHPSATPETHTGQVQGIAVGLRGGNRHSVIHSNVNSNAGQMTLRATLVGNLDYKANNSSATQLRATPPNRDDIGHAGIPHGSRESLAPSKRSPAAFINGFELRQPGASITDIGPHQLQFVQAHSPSGNVTQPSPVMAAYTPSDKGDKQGVVTRDLPHLGHPQAPHNNTPEKPASSHNHLHRRSSSAALAMQPLLPKLPSHSAADPTSSFMTNQHSQPHVVLLERPPSVQPGRAHKKSLESMIDPVGLSALANPPPNSNKYMHVHGPAQSQPEWIPPGSASTQAPTIPTLSTALGTSSTPKADRRTSIQKPSSAGTKHPTSENGVAESAIPQSTPKPVRLNIQHKGLADILFSPTVTKTSPSVSHVQHQDRPFEKLNGSGESLLVAKDASPLLVAPLRSHQRTDSGHADNDLGRQERATNPRFVNNHDVPDPRNMPTKQSATHPISSIQAVESKVKLSPASGHSINIGRPNDDHSSTPPAPAHVSTRRSNDVVVSTQAQLPPSSSQNAPQFWQPPPEPFTDNTHRAQTSSHGRLHSSSNVPTVDVPRKRDRRKSITPNLENTKQPILGGTGTSTPSLAFQGHQTTHPVHIPTSIPQTVQPSPRVEDTRAPPPTPILIPPTSGQFTPITRVMSVDTGLQSPATSAGLSLQVNTSRVSLPTELPDPKGKSRLFGNILPSFSSRSKHSKDVKDQSATQAEPRTPFKQEKEKEKDSLSNSKLKKKDRDKDRDKERARNTAGERDKEEKRTLPAKAADDSAKADHVVYTPFTYKLPKKKWTMSAASLEARDGISTNATTIIGSPTTSVLSQNPAFQLPPLRDPLKAAKEWQKKEAAELRLLPGGKVKRHPPGVTFIDVEDDSPHRAHTSKPTRSKKRAR